MAKSSTSINAVKFRLGRVAKDWGELAAILRQAAAEPGYCGPDVEPVERVAGDLAVVRSAVHNWVLDEALRRRPRPGLRGPAARVVRELFRG
jgi:hypothetical protein